VAAPKADDAGDTGEEPTVQAVWTADTEKEVVQLLARRAEARHGRRFNEADQLRDALLARGVQISDTLGVWRSNDNSSGPLTGQLAYPSWVSSGYDERDEVERCVFARERMRFTRDWTGADRARRDLEVRLGVQVDDVQQRWWRTRPLKGGSVGSVEGSTCYHSRRT
jgi:cysteinyl-tRNA synthetase